MCYTTAIYNVHVVMESEEENSKVRLVPSLSRGFSPCFSERFRLFNELCNCLDGISGAEEFGH